MAEPQKGLQRCRIGWKEKKKNGIGQPKIDGCGKRERESDGQSGEKRRESGTENGGGRGCQEVNFTLSSRS